MKNFEIPEIKVEVLAVEDVITTSLGGNELPPPGRE